MDEEERILERNEWIKVDKNNHGKGGDSGKEVFVEGGEGCDKGKGGRGKRRGEQGVGSTVIVSLQGV